MAETVFVEAGLPVGAIWSVTYNGVKKSSVISFTGGGNIITFSNPPGDYSFSIPSSMVIRGRVVIIYKPNDTGGPLSKVLMLA